MSVWDSLLLMNIVTLVSQTANVIETGQWRLLGVEQLWGQVLVGVGPRNEVTVLALRTEGVAEVRGAVVDADAGRDTITQESLTIGQRKS